MKSLTEKLRDESHGDPVLALITLFMWALMTFIVGSIAVFAAIGLVALLVTRTIWTLASLAALALLARAVWRLIMRATK